LQSEKSGAKDFRAAFVFYFTLENAAGRAGTGPAPPAKVVFLPAGSGFFCDFQLDFKFG
jgi:hypothetical protein